MIAKDTILVTGAAGFIGWKVCEFLLTKPELISPIIPSPSTGEGKGEGARINVVGVDNMNDYYDVRLKNWRLEQLKKLSRHCEESSGEAISNSRFTFHHLDIENYSALKDLFKKYSVSPSARTSAAPFHAIINLAARAGVRYSMENPFVYYTTNVMGTLNLLELCKEFKVRKFILASTSSLYAGQKMPFKEDLPVNEPISPYAASKKGAEVTCYTYHHLYNIDISILRYFTVYGPASRPDMSPLRFISWVYQGKPVIIYGDGNQSRDFTYVDDIADGTIMALKPLGFEIINLGGDKSCKLLEFLHLIENKLGKKAKITKEPSHPADMQATWADITKAREFFNWKPNFNIEQGIKISIDWYLKNHRWLGKIKL